MAKTFQAYHPTLERWKDWICIALHRTDVPDQPFRDFHTVFWCQHDWFPNRPSSCAVYVKVYDRAKAQGMALSLVANPDLVSDLCTLCRADSRSPIFPRWGGMTPPARPPSYINWPEPHRAIVPACISWDIYWSWEPYPIYPWE